MIVKQLIHKSPAGEQLQAASGCQGCNLGCIATDERGQPERVAVSGWRLHSVVMVLFGAPLLVLVGTVITLQASGLADHPLTSLFLLAAMLAVAVNVIMPRGASLLSYLQVQRLPAIAYLSPHEAQNNIRNNTA